MTMEFLYRTATPAYRGCTPPPTQAPTSFLAGLWCSLFGAAKPAYQTRDANGAPAPVEPRCFWQVVPSAQAYKAAPSVTSSEPEPTLSRSAGHHAGEDDEATDGVPALFIWEE
jgi:hypothetical protein